MKSGLIKIAFIIDWIYAPEGGTEGQLLMLLNGLDRATFEPHLVYLRNTDYMTKTCFEFPVHKLSVGRMFSLNTLIALQGFRELHGRESFDIVQTLFVDGNVFGTIAAHFAGCKLIISSRRNLGYWHDSTQVTMLRFLRRWTDHYLANSLAAAEKTIQTEGVPPVKVTVIHNGLELREFSRITPRLRAEQRSKWGIADSDVVVGGVANLRKIKNIDSLMRAAVVLLKDYNHLKFVWIGRGLDGEHEHYLKLVADMGLDGRFFFPGPSEDIVCCLAGFDIAVLCSRSESFSNSLVEYMAAGLPIVASDVGGNVEAIDHGVTGLLYPVDQDSELISSIGRLITDRALASRLGQSAREVSHSAFSREAMIRQHERFYLRILGR